MAAPLGFVRRLHGLLRVMPRHCAPAAEFDSMLSAILDKAFKRELV